MTEERVVIVRGADFGDTEARVLAYLRAELGQTAVSVDVSTLDIAQAIMALDDMRVSTDNLAMAIRNINAVAVDEPRLKPGNSKPNYIERPYGRNYRKGFK